MKLDALRAKIQRGLADLEAGRVTDSEEVFTDLDNMIDRAQG